MDILIQSKQGKKINEQAQGLLAAGHKLLLFESSAFFVVVVKMAELPL